jgi:hypothetical protein
MEAMLTLFTAWTCVLMGTVTLYVILVPDRNGRRLADYLRDAFSRR